MVLTDPNRPDSPVIFVNRASGQLTGYGEDEVLGRNCRVLQGEATDQTAIRSLSAAIHSGRQVQVELWNCLNQSSGSDARNANSPFKQASLQMLRRL